MVERMGWAAHVAIGTLLSLFVVWGAAHAAVPQRINYQGYLTNAASQPVSATVTMVFRLYTAPTGGTAIYTETQSVTVANGIYNVALGTVTPLNLPFDVPYYLGVTVGADAEMTPRQAVLSSPYALRAGSVDPTSSTLTGSFFRQGGNAFGSTASLGTNDGQPLEFRVNGQRIVRYESGNVSPNVVSGSPANFVVAHAYGGTIGGGGVPAGDTDPAFAAEGPNRVFDAYGTVGGGYNNQAGGGGESSLDRPFATVAGGALNEATGRASTVAGGEVNFARGDFSNVAGGQSNVAQKYASSVAGGTINVAQGDHSMVAGGWKNTASGDFSLAAGVRAKALHHRSFVWGGSVGDDTESQADGDFVVYAPGGVRMYAGPIGSGGCTLTSGASGWQCASDRALKSGIVPVNVAQVLDLVAVLPIARWSFTVAPGVSHMGPMAQDFHTAFGLGDDPTRLAPLDVQGVALAAIQGLNAKLDAQAAERDAEIAALRQALADKNAQVTAQQRELDAQRAELASQRERIAHVHDDQRAELARLRERVAEVESVRHDLAAMRDAMAEMKQERFSVVATRD